MSTRLSYPLRELGLTQRFSMRMRVIQVIGKKPDPIPGRSAEAASTVPDETTVIREAEGSLGDQQDAIPPYASLLMRFSARLEDQMTPEQRAEFDLQAGIRGM